MAKKLFLLGLILLLCILSLTGCGSTTDSKSTAEPTTLAAASQDYPNAGLLVSAASVQNNLHAGNMVLIDARGAGYTTSHIPGAINLKHSDYWTGGTGLKPVATLQTMLGNSGLRRDMTFVIYDDTTASWGAAGRIFWMLEYLGCGDVHIINGGWDKWVADGRLTEAATNTLAPATFTAVVDKTKRSDKLSILNKMSNSNFVIIDARTDEEYLGWQLYGEARGGHIPGAVNIPYAWFFQADKTLLTRDALKSLLESRGIRTDREVTSHCTAGIRSGFVYFTLRLMGYPQASNYDASMLEWAADPVVPEEKAPNYSRVVYAGWVDSLIKGTNPSTLPAGNGYRIFECSWGPTSAAYNTGHIPGTIHFDTNNVEARNYLDPTNPLVSDANEIV